MLTMRRLLIILLLLLIATNAVCATPRNFYERKSEGWFWHQDPPVPKEPEKKEEPKPVPPPVEDPEVAETTEDPGPAPMSAAWIREHMQEYLDRATDDPTPENVSAYFYLQRLMMDKSQRFADVSQRVVYGDAMLDESVRHPIATFGSGEAARQSNQKINELLATLSKKVGIWFFFQSTCGFCEKQAPVMMMLEQRYGFKIYPISLDGAGLKSGAMPNYVVDRGQSAQLNVMQTPAMFLVNPETKEISPLGQGALALEELRKRILVAAMNAGWISEEMYNDTRSVQGPLLEQPTKQDQENEDELKENPNLLIELLRKQLQQGS